jgi:hypothetical protein
MRIHVMYCSNRGRHVRLAWPEIAVGASPDRPDADVVCLDVEASACVGPTCPILLAPVAQILARRGPFATVREP